jgi:hypothetical protein
VAENYVTMSSFDREVGHSWQENTVSKIYAAIQEWNPSHNMYYICFFSNPSTRHGGAWEERYSSYSFSTSALDGGQWPVSRPGRAFTRGERIPGTHCTGGWVGLRAGLDSEVRGKILCPRRGSNPDRLVVQPIVRHYTAWANPAHIYYMYICFIFACSTEVLE